MPTVRQPPRWRGQALMCICHGGSMPVRRSRARSVVSTFERRDGKVAEKSGTLRTAHFLDDAYEEQMKVPFSAVRPKAAA